MSYKKNVAIKVNYVALHRQTGLTDLEMKIYDETGAELGSGLSPITLVAVPSNGGAYYGSFTPDAKGQWRIRITSATNNDDIQKVFEISNSDVDEVKLQTQSIEDKTDIIDTVVDATKVVVDATKVVVDNTEDKVDIIDGNVDQALLDIAAAKVVIDATKVVVDATKVVVDSIDDQISTGGYLMN
jgi:hypothetical protein